MKPEMIGMSRVLIVGGGAAGMFAAVTAARNGQEAFLFEKNEKLGKKLFITGKVISRMHVIWRHCFPR